MLSRCILLAIAKPVRFGNPVPGCRIRVCPSITMYLFKKLVGLLYVVEYRVL
jgi:hypothetical protein